MKVDSDQELPRLVDDVPLVKVGHDNYEVLALAPSLPFATTS